MLNVGVAATSSRRKPWKKEEQAVEMSDAGRTTEVEGGKYFCRLLMGGTQLTFARGITRFVAETRVADLAVGALARERGRLTAEGAARQDGENGLGQMLVADGEGSEKEEGVEGEVGVEQLEGMEIGAENTTTMLGKVLTRMKEEGK